MQTAMLKSVLLKDNRRALKVILFVIFICIVFSFLLSGIYSVMGRDFKSDTGTFNQSENTNESLSFYENISSYEFDGRIKMRDINMLARLIWGEARGVESTTQKTAVVWCALNRVDAPEFPNTITDVIHQPNQFIGYSERNPITEDNAAIAKDVLMRWYAEKDGCIDVGRTLPCNYKYFEGDGRVNYFTEEWKSTNKWDWSLWTPYDN